jgi:hypothetical protein
MYYLALHTPFSQPQSHLPDLHPAQSLHPQLHASALQHVFLQLLDLNVIAVQTAATPTNIYMIASIRSYCTPLLPSKEFKTFQFESTFAKKYDSPIKPQLMPPIINNILLIFDIALLTKYISKYTFA